MTTASTMAAAEHQHTHATLHRDPVCGMSVDPDAAAGTSTYQGRTYYLCSSACKATFDEHPEAYVELSLHAGHGNSSPHNAPTSTRGPEPSLNRLALSATVHCLTGCATGEVLGLVIGTALGWSTWPTIALAVTLAFMFGYLFTLVPLVRAGMGFRAAFRLALAADTASITIMEVVDNGVMLVIPGAMDAGLAEAFFWGSLGLSLVLAGVAAYPVNRWLLARGRGHALVHHHHGHHA